MIQAMTRKHTVRPCAHCPFRNDRASYLTHERAAEIARSMANDAPFHCHETTVPTDDGNEMTTDDKSLHCAGALLVMEASNLSTNWMRVGERIGWYRPDEVVQDAPVHESLDAWVAAHRTDDVDDELEHCGVVAEDCEDPAGYSAGGGAIENYDPPTCSIDDECTECGSRMCTACRGPSGTMCVYCEDDD